MPAPARPNTVLTLDRLRLAVARNTPTARRSADVTSVVTAADAQAQAVGPLRSFVAMRSARETVDRSQR